MVSKLKGTAGKRKWKCCVSELWKVRQRITVKCAVKTSATHTREKIARAQACEVSVVFASSETAERRSALEAFSSWKTLAWQEHNKGVTSPSMMLLSAQSAMFACVWCAGYWRNVFASWLKEAGQPTQLKRTRRSRSFSFISLSPHPSPFLSQPLHGERKALLL